MIYFLADVYGRFLAVDANRPACDDAGTAERSLLSVDPAQRSKDTQRSPEEQSMDTFCHSAACGMKIVSKLYVKDERGNVYCAEGCRREARAAAERKASLRRLAQPESERRIA